MAYPGAKAKAKRAASMYNAQPVQFVQYPPQTIVQQPPPGQQAIIYVQPGPQPPPMYVGQPQMAPQQMQYYSLPSGVHSGAQPQFPPNNTAYAQPMQQQKHVFKPRKYQNMHEQHAPARYQRINNTNASQIQHQAPPAYNPNALQKDEQNTDKEIVPSAPPPPATEHLYPDLSDKFFQQ